MLTTAPPGLSHSISVSEYKNALKRAYSVWLCSSVIYTFTSIAVNIALNKTNHHKSFLGGATVQLIKQLWV